MEAQCYNVANSESQLIIESPCNRRPKLSCWPSTTLKLWYPDDLVLKDSFIQSNELIPRSARLKLRLSMLKSLALGDEAKSQPVFQQIDMHVLHELWNEEL